MFSSTEEKMRFKLRVGTNYYACLILAPSLEV